MTGTLPPVRCRVVKVGGSVLDNGDSAKRVRDWLRSPCDLLTLVICGGGRLADVVRRLDGQSELPAPVSHRLAMDAMAVHLRMMHALLPETRLEKGRPAQAARGRAGETVFFDVREWVLEENPGPESWDFTSDSIAAALAVEIRAEMLVLLKSRCPDPGTPADQVFRSGLVDGGFRQAVGGVGSWQVIDFSGPALGSWTSPVESDREVPAGGSRSVAASIPVEKKG